MDKLGESGDMFEVGFPPIARKAWRMPAENKRLMDDLLGRDDAS